MSDTTAQVDNKGKGDAKATKEGQPQDARPPRDFDAERELREFEKTNTKVFIGNLPAYYPAYDRKNQREGAKAHVENLCQRYGTFKSEDVIVNAEKRFAFVTFATRDAAQYAIYQLPGTGGGITCGWAKPTEKQKADSRKGREEADKKAEAAEKKEKDEKVVVGKDGKEAPKEVEVTEKPRFSAQQKVAAPQKKATPPPVVAAKPVVQHQQQQNQPRQNQGGNRGNKQNQNQNQKVAQPQKAPAPAPQRFKVSVQNETTGVVATISISLEDWHQYIYPLFEQNKVVLH